jgi:hypothetical protein
VFHHSINGLRGHTNDAATKRGYEVIGELKDYIVPGHSEILLRKTIAPLTEFNKH